MPDAPMEDRHFTDREVREILKRAVEESPSRGLSRGEGLSLSELKTIGAEVGIEPSRLEEAARAVVQAGRHRPNPLLGAPTVLTFQRDADGGFDPDDTPEILALIRRVMGTQGEVNEIHGSLEWRTRGDVGERYVTLSARDGQTSIQSSANLTAAAVLTFLPAGIIGFITSITGLIKFIQDGSQIGLILFLAVLPILYPILRGILRKVSRSESAKLQRVTEELARMLEGCP